MSVGRKDRRISIQTFGPSQGPGGGTQGAVTFEYEMWADIEERDGSSFKDQSQRQTSYNYLVKVRFERTRPITTKQFVVYENKRLAINSVTRVREGMRWENHLRCSTL